MTDEQLQRLINEIREARRQIVEKIQKANKRETTEYQPCPICKGNGWAFPMGNSANTAAICHYCNGSKTVVKSITK
jgi:DnaJ-class molecular chaperone